jgi:hypothetical protein
MAVATGRHHAVARHYVHIRTNWYLTRTNRRVACLEVIIVVVPATTVHMTPYVDTSLNY